MRVCKLQEILRQPVGTVFSSFDPRVVEGLFVKESSLPDDEGKLIDFFHRRLLAEPVPLSFYRRDDDDTKTEFRPIGESSGRWANYDNEELFIIYEEADLVAIRNAIAGPAKRVTRTDGQPVQELDGPQLM